MMFSSITMSKMKRNVLRIPDEYTAALSARFEFDLNPSNLATRIGKAFIAQKAEIVSYISQGLTKNRNEFFASDYLKKKDIREAYSLYYMTTNLLKIIPPLQELSLSHFFERTTPLHILDLGTGTGAASWGLLSYLNEHEPKITAEIMLTDSLQENLHEAENFSRHLAPLLSGKNNVLTFEKYDLRSPENIPAAIKNSSPYHLITIMNVLNELDEERDSILFESVMSLLDEDGALVMVEPATRDQSRRLLRFRDLAVSKGATIYSPCTRQNVCPALIKEDDWCHTEVKWERPPFIKAIDEIAGTLRLSLKYTYVIIRKDGATLSNAIHQNSLYRVVSERFDEKGRFRAILCGENGRYEHVMNKRDLSENNKDFAEIERYDVIHLTGEEVREHDIRLPKEAEFSLVLPVLGAR